MIKSNKFVAVSYENGKIPFVSRSPVLYNGLMQRLQESEEVFTDSNERKAEALMAAR